MSRTVVVARLAAALAVGFGALAAMPPTSAAIPTPTSSATTRWTAPGGQAVRAASTGSGGGRITTVLTDGSGPEPTGTRGGLTATADSAGSRAVMFTVVLKLAG